MDDDVREITERLEARLKLQQPTATLSVMQTDDAPSVPMKIVYDANRGTFRPNRTPVNEQEWRELCLLRWEDSEKIRQSDPFCARNITWSTFYQFMNQTEEKFLRQAADLKKSEGGAFEQSHIRCQMPIVHDPHKNTNTKSFYRIAVVGMTNRYAVIAASLKQPQQEEKKAAEDESPSLEKMIRDEKNKQNLDKNALPEKFCLYRMDLWTKEFDTELIRWNEPQKLNSPPDIERKLATAFQVDIKNCKPCYEELDDCRLTGTLLMSCVTDSGIVAVLSMTAGETRKNQVERYAEDTPSRRIHFFDVHANKHLGMFSLPSNAGLPDQISCSDTGQFFVVTYNRSSGKLMVGDDGATTATPPAGPTPPEAVSDLPAHVVLYAMSGWFDEKSIKKNRGPVDAPPSTLYVPVSGGLKALRHDTSMTYVSEITCTAFQVGQKPSEHTLYVCTADGSVHELQIVLEKLARKEKPFTQPAKYEATRVVLVPARDPYLVEELPEHRLKKSSQDSSERGDEAERHPELGNMGPHADGLINFFKFQAGTEPRILAASSKRIVIHSGSDSQVQEKLERGKIARWTSPPIGTCISLGNCGNLLVRHDLKTNNVYYGNLATMSDTKLFDDPSLLAEMDKADGPYRSVLVFCDRFFVLYPNGIVAAFLTNDQEFQAKYNEEKTKALEERQRLEDQRRQVREAVEEARRKQREEEASRKAATASKHAIPVQK